MAKSKKHADHRADTRSKALSGLPHVVADSDAYLALTPFDRAVLGEILRKFNGYNNGAIVISYEQIGERVRGPNTGRPNNGRIGRAIATLIAHGLIAEPTPASWLERRAREYRLTFISYGKGPPYRSASNEYRQWRRVERKNDGDAPSPRKPLNGDARSPEQIALGDPASSDGSKIRRFALAADAPAGDSESLLIDSHTPLPATSSGATVIPMSRFGT